MGKLYDAFGSGYNYNPASLGDPFYYGQRDTWATTSSTNIVTTYPNSLIGVGPKTLSVPTKKESPLDWLDKEIEKMCSLARAVG